MSVTARRRASRVLVGCGAVALLAALVFAYLDRNVFAARGFADHAVQAVRDDAVRDRIAPALSDAIVARHPRAVAAAPVITSVTRGLLASDQAAAVVRRAAVETHHAVFSATKGSVVIDLANLGVVAIELLRTQRPDLAGRVDPERGELVFAIADRSLTVDAVALADRVRVLALVLPLLAVALFAVALLVAPARRRAALDAGAGIAIAGVAGLGLLVVARAFVLARPPGGDRDVAAAVFDAFLGGFVWWCLVVIAAGVLLAASAVSVAGDVDPASLPAATWAWIRRDRESALATFLGALALLTGGVLVVRDPAGALQLAAAILGAWMIFAALVALLRLALGPRAAEGELPAPRVLVRRVAPVAVAAAVLVALAGAAIGLVLGGRSSAEPAAAARTGCNGAVALCDRPFNAVVFPTSHNANATAQAGYLNANHGLEMIRQLDLGVRGLLIDAILGRRNGDGVVRTDLAPKAVEAAEAKVGPAGLAAAQRLAGSVAFGPVAGDKQLYLCHILCELGALDGVDSLRAIRDWLDRNPREVLMMVVEDAAPTDAIKKAFEESGLAAYASDADPRSGRVPTLGQMIASGKRLFVMAEDHGEATGWYHRAYDVMMETPFAFRSPAELATDQSCRPNRGGTGKPLFLVNSWVESYPPNPRDADVVNRKSFLVDRARRCERIRHHVPNLLAVDFVERGDLIGATDELNGVATR